MLTRQEFIIFKLISFQMLAFEFSKVVSASAETSIVVNSLPAPISVEEAILEPVVAGVEKLERIQFPNLNLTSNATLVEDEPATSPSSKAAMNETLKSKTADTGSAFTSEDVVELAMIGSSKVSEYLDERAIALMGIALAEKLDTGENSKVKLSLVLKRAGQQNQAQRTLCNLVFKVDETSVRNHEVIDYECIEAGSSLNSTRTAANSSGIMWYQTEPDYDISAVIFATAELMKEKGNNLSKPFNPILLDYARENQLEKLDGNEIKLQLYLSNIFNHDESHIVCNADVHLEQRILYGADCVPIDKAQPLQPLNAKAAFAYVHVNSSLIKDAAQFAIDVMTKSPTSLTGHWALIKVTEARILSHRGSVRRLRLSFGKQGLNEKPYVSCLVAVYEDKTSGNYELLYGSNYTKCELFPFNE